MRGIIEKIGSMPVSKLMIKKFYYVTPDTPVKSIIKRLKDNNPRAIPVLEGDKFIGEVWEWDLLKMVIDPKDLPLSRVVGLWGTRIALEGIADTAGELVTKHGFSVKPTDLVKDAALIMLNEDVAILPVIDKGRQLGIISDYQIIKRFYGAIK